jgi:hypothetical protein
LAPLLFLVGGLCFSVSFVFVRATVSFPHLSDILCRLTSSPLEQRSSDAVRKIMEAPGGAEAKIGVGGQVPLWLAKTPNAPF